jgi:hypothetical protein
MFSLLLASTIPFVSSEVETRRASRFSTSLEANGNVETPSEGDA